MEFSSFSQSFQFKKNLFNYIRSIQSLIPYTCLPVRVHNGSEMLCFKFAQQLFRSTAKVLILQSTNYIKASEGGGEKKSASTYL